MTTMKDKVSTVGNIYCVAR